MEHKDNYINILVNDLSYGHYIISKSLFMVTQGTMYQTLYPQDY